MIAIRQATLVDAKRLLLTGTIKDLCEVMRTEVWNANVRNKILPII